MIDYKHLGDSHITIMQKRRGRKQVWSNRITIGLSIVGVVYFGVNLILWGLK